MKISKNNSNLIKWSLFDWAMSPFSTVIQTFIFSTYFIKSVAETENLGALYWGYVLTASGLFVALVAPILGCANDQGLSKKRSLIFFSLLCCISTACMWFIQAKPSYTLLALLLAFIGTVGSEMTYVFYNAMLPELSKKKYVGKWSGIGWGVGYLGGVVFLVLAYALVINPTFNLFNLDSSKYEHIRSTFALTALWLFLFSLPIFSIPDTQKIHRNVIKSFYLGFKQLIKSLKNFKEDKEIFYFLIANMLFKNGIVGIYSFAGIYAVNYFNLKESELFLFAIFSNIAAGILTIFSGYIDDYFGSKKTLMFIISATTLTFFILLLNTSIIGFWVLSLLGSAFIGPIFSSSRSFMAKITPKEKENQNFGLFALSGRISSFLSPFFIGNLTYLTGSLKIGLGFNLVFFIISLIILSSISLKEDI